jgi:hypothetical protein
MSDDIDARGRDAVTRLEARKRSEGNGHCVDRRPELYAVDVDDPGRATEPPADDADRTPVLADRILTRSALRKLPDPEPLIDNVLDQGTTALLYGSWAFRDSGMSSTPPRSAQTVSRPNSSQAQRGTCAGELVTMSSGTATFLCRLGPQPS